MIDVTNDPSCITHALAAADAQAMTSLRAAVAPAKGRLRGTGAREPFDAIMSHVIPPTGVTYQPDTVGGVSGWWCKPAPSRPAQVLLYFHGGWFNWGSAQAYRHLVGHIASQTGADAFIPDYRLAPEHPFPAAVDDALACHHGLKERGLDRIAPIGDSAGGCMALVLSSLVSAQLSSGGGGGGGPVGVVALSPLTDLTLAGQSWETRAAADPYFTKLQAAELVQAYIGAADPMDPRVSPLYGNLAGLPPVRVLVGDDEMLLDDSRRYVERAVSAGVDARLDVWEGMPHVFLTGIGTFDAAAQALNAIGRFLRERLTGIKV
jgi:acetyl esterase/lipase